MSAVPKAASAPAAAAGKTPKPKQVKTTVWEALGDPESDVHELHVQACRLSNEAKKMKETDPAKAKEMQSRATEMFLAVLTLRMRK